MFTAVVATLAVNIAANVVSPANDFANAFPRLISFKTGGLITGLLGIVMQPWRLLADPSGYIFNWLLGYSGGLGSIAGVLIADYWFVRRRQLRLEDLYLVDGAYKGWNPPAVVATLVGCALAWGGLVLPAAQAALRLRLVRGLRRRLPGLRWPDAAQPEHERRARADARGLGPVPEVTSMSTVLSSTTLTGEEIVALCRRHTIYEWSAQAKVDPIPVARAKGVYFWTPEGKRYLDFNSQLMCVNIGHSHPRVIKAIQEQAATLAYANPFMATEPRARLGAKLAEITPGDIDIFFFTNGGAEANENAIRIARVASPAATRSWRATARTTAAPRARSRSPAIRGAGPPSRASPASSACPTFHKWGAEGPGAARRLPARARGGDPLRGRARTSRRSSWRPWSAPTAS